MTDYNERTGVWEDDGDVARNESPSLTPATLDELERLERVRREASAARDLAYAEYCRVILRGPSTAARRHEELMSAHMASESDLSDALLRAAPALIRAARESEKMRAVCVSAARQARAAKAMRAEWARDKSAGSAATSVPFCRWENQCRETERLAEGLDDV